MKDKRLLGLKIFFWTIFFGTLSSIPIVLFLDSKSLIPLWLIKSNKLFSGIVYSNGLSLIFSIIGFLVVAIIFLMEFIASRYRTEELDNMPIFKKYFMATLFIFFMIIIFNLWALYSELVYPYTLISLIFSASVLLLIFTSILLVFFNLKVSVILGMLSDQISQFIAKKKNFKKIPVFGDISYSDEFINALKNKVSIFIKNSINAVKNNQDVIFKESLNSIRNITKEYLKNSKHIQATEDKFLDELNDQFNFIIAESLNSSNQKILEDVAKTIGAISCDVIEYRRGIGDVNNFALNWLGTLKDLFIKSYNKDRTIVCHICLEEINKVILLTLDKGYYRSYNSYNMFIDDISKTLSKINQYWSAILLRKSLVMYENQFLKFLELLKKNKIIFSDFFIKQYFDNLVEIINEAKNVHKPFGNNAVIFASLWGIDSFAQKIVKTDLSNLRENKIKKGIFRYMENFIRFNKKVAEENSTKNDSSFYDVFSETLFLLSKYIDFEDEDRIKLIKELSNVLLDIIERKSNAVLEGDRNVPINIKETIIDYFALLIYLHSDKPILLKQIFDRFLGIYNEVKKKDKKGFVSDGLYRELKLYSCWVNKFDNLKEINRDLIKVLKRDFYEPKIEGKAIPPLFAQSGYPSGFIGDGSWYLHPSHMWGNIFQEEISNKLNGSSGENYIKFHKMLKSQKRKTKK